MSPVNSRSGGFHGAWCSHLSRHFQLLHYVIVIGSHYFGTRSCRKLYLLVTWPLPHRGSLKMLMLGSQPLSILHRTPMFTTLHRPANRFLDEHATFLRNRSPSCRYCG